MPMKPVLVFLALVASAVRGDESIRVMTFNLWHGGDAGGHPLSQSVKAIVASKADIVGLQETHGDKVDGVRPDNGAEIARRLGWNYLQQGDRTGILSRYPIGKASKHKWGVAIEYADNKTLHFYNAHFEAAPYQPYQLLGIPYGGGKFINSESDAIAEAKLARGASVSRLIAEMKEAIESKLPVILTGDFNEPSHQDWTERAAHANCCPIKVRYPTTRRISTAGLIDTWRSCHAHEVKFRGLTWTNTTSADDPNDKHDRIDYVFVSKSRMKVQQCMVVGEKKATADIVVSPWPSDHRAVVAELIVFD